MNDVVHKRGTILESTAKKGIQLAAEDGYLSPRVQNILREDLENLHGDTSKLTMEPSTTTPVLRGQPVTITLRYPVGQMYIFKNYFGEDDTTLEYHYTFSENSEYLP